ncbi:MAG TPA: LysR family transcriptional regulator [Kofleriaceae bacterium]|nr:LysR family transcriptional regulator [Kofleriaceae bacterium]
MDLNEILVFVHVVQEGSFSAAAGKLEMPKSTASRKVSALEDRLGARLLHRTTRKLSLTDAGKAYYQHAARVVAEVNEAGLAVTRLQGTPRGRLRVTAPLNFGYLGPIVASFLKRYPQVQLEVVCADRVVDLVDEGFDVAVRAGNLADSTLIARHLGVLRQIVVASPVFLRNQGEPETPADLSRFDCVAFGAGPDRTAWHLVATGGDTATIAIRARMVVNDFDFLHQAALGGLGLALLPISSCADDLRAHRLSRVLGDWRSRDVPIHAVYPSTRYLSPTVKAFLDHLREKMTPPPWELGPLP